MLAASYAEDFFGQAVRLESGVWAIEAESGVLIVRHPLESPTDGPAAEHMTLTERMDGALVEAEERARGAPIRFASSFDLQRRPGWVIAQLG